MIARLMLDLPQMMRDNLLAPGLVSARCNVPKDQFYRDYESFSSIVFGSVLFLLQYPMTPPFFYQPKDPAKTKWGTHHVRIDPKFFHDAIREAYGYHGGFKRIGVMLDLENPTQLKNFIHYTRDNQRSWTYDRNLMGSLCVLFGVTPPAPFWLLRGDKFQAWYKENNHATV